MKILFILVFLTASLYAHEPLFGFGPHVLFKEGFAPHITVGGDSEELETEYSLGYGVTRNWTLIGEVPWVYDGDTYQVDALGVKSKYRFWLKAAPGVSYQASFLTKLEAPLEQDAPKNLKLGITGGQEALRVYWFLTGGYSASFGGLKNGLVNGAFYNAAVGYRPFPSTYYQPDIAFFMEAFGNATKDTSTFAVAPTFFFTYRNLAVRGGVDFGVLARSQWISPGYRLTVEFHL